MEFLELPSFGGLELAGPARADAPFVLPGRLSLALGTEAGGVDELYVHPYRVLRQLRMLDAEAVAVRITANGCERRLNVGGREIVERIFVPAATPGAVIEWKVLPARVASAACMEPVELDLEWLSPLDTGSGPAGGLRGEATGRRLLVWAADGRGAAFEASRSVSTAVDVLTPAPARRGAAPRLPAVRCRMGVRLGPEEVFRLSVAAAPDGARLENALADLANVPALVQGCAAAGGRRLAQSLVLGAPAPVAGLAMRWAALRLPGFRADVDGQGASIAAGYAHGIHPRASLGKSALRAGLAALPLGDPELALACADCLLAAARSTPAAAQAAHSAGGVAAAIHPVSRADSDPALGALLVYAAHFLWTADPAPLRRVWQELTAHAAEAEQRGGALAAAALGQLALAAESLGDAAGAADLRGRATRLASAEAAATALARAGGWAAWLGDSREDAATAWLQRAEHGLRGARALWGGPAGSSDAAATARLVCGVAYGLLGIEADAPRARVRLRPQVPAAWDRMEAERIRIGDAELRLTYARGVFAHRFTLEPLSGAVPLRVVLEAALPGAPSAVRGTRVDGRAASLDLRSWGAQTIVPVQLVLDDRRVLEVEVERTARG